MTDKKNKTPFYLIDTDADFYRPMGVRLAICISVICWAAIEIYNGDGFWGVISGSAAAYCAYVLFFTYNPPPKQEPVIRPPDPDEEEETEPTANAPEKSDDKG